MTNPGPTAAQDSGGDLDGPGFSSAVLQSFAFLQSTYGFEVETVEPNLIRFRSSRLFVDIWHEWPSGQIGLSIGRLSSSAEARHPFNFSDILYLTGSSNASAYRDYTALSRDSVQAGVNALAGELEAHCGEVLTGSDELFEKMTAGRSERIEKYALTVSDDQVRARVEAAWARRDYAEVARLLGGISDRLSPAEVSKLEYAQHHGRDTPKP